MTPEPDQADEDGRPRTTPLQLAGSLVALTMMGLGQPILEALGNNPAFFIARASPRRDAIVMAVVLGILVPGMLTALVLLVRRVNHRTGEALHGVLLVGLGSLVGLQALRATLGWESGAGLLVAPAAALALTAALYRIDSLRELARWGTVLPGVSLGLFALASPTSGVLLSSDGVVGSAATGAEPIPVTVIVFDALPTASLMAGPDTIDHRRFPHFASFAEDAVWYTNATTTADLTFYALPALLTGRRAPHESLPIAADHPTNLFSLLSTSHTIHAVENYTKLCPRRLCDRTIRDGFPTWVRHVATDLSLVGAHEVLPRALRSHLPAADPVWARAAGGTARPSERAAVESSIIDRGEALKRTDRRRHLERATRAPGERPAARILHSMLPHSPFRYLPTGQQVTYDRMPGVRALGVRTPDEWLARFEQRRHLLQTGLVDRILGQTLDRLRATGDYDDGLVIVTADHGVSFDAGESRRRATVETLASIAPIPLLVKYPDRRGGQTDPRPVQLTDVVPTILDVLGAPVPDGIEGTSLRDSLPSDRPRRISATQGRKVAIPGTLDPWEVGHQVHEEFGMGWRGVYRHGPFAHLIGRSRTELPPARPGGVTAKLRDRQEILGSRADSDPIPALVTGTISFPEPLDEPLFVAVLFDGEIVGVGRTTQPEGNSARLLALVPPRAFTGGVTEIGLLGLHRSEAGLAVEEITIPPD